MGGLGRDASNAACLRSTEPRLKPLSMGHLPAIRPPADVDTVWLRNPLPYMKQVGLMGGWGVHQVLWRGLSLAGSAAWHPLQA